MKTNATELSEPPSPKTPVRLSRPNSKQDRFGKIQKHPWENRKALSEEYEGEISGREGWWRTHIRETPIPGSYDLETTGILYDLTKKQNTYRFKSDGRKIDPHPHGKGATLLPGAYEHHDLVSNLSKSRATYNFKTGERAQYDVLNFGKKDKDINVSPSAYELEKYLSVTCEKQPSKHSVFKSQSRRFPTMQFKPKDGPAPGNYEAETLTLPRRSISSSFKSKTPRFSSSHTRVPGPGSYDKTFQYPQTGVLQKMGRQHGLFFSSAFQA